MRRSTFWHLPAAVAVAVLAGCTPVPRLEPDVLGLGDLPARAVEHDDYFAPQGLPRLDAGCRAGEGGDCPERQTYRLGAFDQVSIRVWGREDLGSQMPIEGGARISEITVDGTITLPFLSTIEVAGLTQEELRHHLVERYAEILERPQVDVHLVACRSRMVAVRGKVSAPGTYALCTDRLTVAAILGAAGGLAPQADGARAALIREGAPFALDFSRPTTDVGSILLEAGDELFVPARGEHAVYVFGEVFQQGVVEIPPQGLDLLQAIASAGGPDFFSAATGQFYLIRPASTEMRVHRLSLADVLASPPISLADGDRVFIPPTKLARWNRWWRLILPTNVSRPLIQEVTRDD